MPRRVLDPASKARCGPLARGRIAPQVDRGDLWLRCTVFFRPARYGIPSSSCRHRRRGHEVRRAAVVYTVVGKGGLVREVLLPHRLAANLEQRRLDVPERVVDRGVRYLQRTI